MKSAILVIAGGYLVLCVLVYFQQRALLYYPVPAQAQLATIAVPADGVEVHAAVVNPAAQAAIVYFGGNAEDVSLSARELATRHPGHAVYALHYRGYGPSGGRPTELALIADANALLALVTERHRAIHVIGRSLGSGVAVQVAAGRDLAGLTLVTPFASIVGIGQRAFWFLPVSLLMQDRYESTRHTAQLRAPVRLIIAERDEIIPRWSSDALLQSFPEGRRPDVVIIEARGHNDVQLDPHYWRALVPTAP